MIIMKKINQKKKINIIVVSKLLSQKYWVSFLEINYPVKMYTAKLVGLARHKFITKDMCRHISEDKHK